MSQQITPMGTVVAADTREEAVRMFVQASMGCEAADYGVKLKDGQIGAFRSHSQVYRPFSPLSGQNTAQTLEQSVPALSVSRDTSKQTAYEATCGACDSISVASDGDLLHHCVVCGEALDRTDEGEAEDVEVELEDDVDFGVGEEESVSSFEEAEADDSDEEEGETEDDLSADGDEQFYAEVTQQQIDELSEDALAELSDAVGLALGEEGVDLSAIDELPEDTRQVLNETYAEMFGKAEYRDEGDDEAGESFESESASENSGDDVAAAITKKSGIKVTADDYETWLEGEGDMHRFQKAVQKLIPAPVWEKVETAALQDAAVRFVLFGKSTYGTSADKRLASLLKKHGVSTSGPGCPMDEAEEEFEAQDEAESTSAMVEGEAEDVADAVSKQSGIKVTADDYLAWLGDGGPTKGSYDKFDRAVRKVIPAATYARLEKADLLGLGLEYALDLWGLGSNPQARAVKKIFDSTSAAASTGEEDNHAHVAERTGTEAVAAEDSPLSVSSLSLAPGLENFHLVYAGSNVVGADRYYAIANGIPVAYATHAAVAEAHGQLYEAWGTEDFPVAVSKMVEADGAEALAAAGFTPFTYEVKAENLVKNAVAEASQQLEATYKAEVKEVAEDVRAAISTAYVGLNKGFFKDREHPIKIDLFDRIHSVLCSSGFDEGQAAEVTASIIDSSFEQAGEDFGRQLMEAGFELLEMPREARNSLTKAIVGTTDQSPTNSVSHILSSRLGRFGR